MKKLCAAVFLFDSPRRQYNYFAYLPFYIYSMLKAYPDYCVRAYVDTALPPKIEKQLSLLSGMGGFEVIENYSLPGLDKGNDPNGDIRKSVRWLCADEAFFEYEAVYIGDVDILIGREEPGIFEGHTLHCGVLGLPYSNILRPNTEKTGKDARYLIECWAKGFGTRQLFRYLRRDASPRPRLSGLHFVKSAEYYRAVGEAAPALIKELNEALAGKSRYWNMYGSPFNEHVLYRLIEKSGLSLPRALSGEEAEYRKQHPSDPLSRGYRPLHGIHLVDFRGNHAPSKDKFRDNSAYVNTYRQFCENLETDERLRKLADSCEPFMAGGFERMRAAFEEAGYGYNAARR